MSTDLLHSPAFYTWVKDPAERALKTFGQTFIVIFLASGSAGLGNHQRWLAALIPAAFATAVSLLTTYLGLLTGLHTVHNAWGDLALRAAKTFLQAFVGSILATHATTFIAGDWKAAFGVAVAALIASVATSLMTVGNPQTLGASTIRQIVLTPEANDVPKMTRPTNVVAEPVVESHPKRGTHTRE